MQIFHEYTPASATRWYVDDKWTIVTICGQQTGNCDVMWATNGQLWQYAENKRATPTHPSFPAKTSTSIPQSRIPLAGIPPSPCKNLVHGFTILSLYIFPNNLTSKSYNSLSHLNGPEQWMLKISLILLFQEYGQRVHYLSSFYVPRIHVSCLSRMSLNP